VNLIPRLYDPTKGRILVDGHDARAVTRDSLRRQISIVLQDPFLFNGTVRENISYARPDAGDQEIVDAARAAYAHGFITQLSDGYETQIGERGVKLSGGQKQRLAIARALLADRRILILDEATAMVDSEAEYEIQQALRRLMRGRTTFVIAHRLSTIKNARQILTLDGGSVVEHGDHQSLLALNGKYSQMYQAQFRLALEDEDEEHTLPLG
jgi:ABC-type multidrug transport system fused ATPase/permease subunit